MSRRGDRGKAAYFLVDLTELDPETRKELIEDAQAGGGEYGLRVVEIVFNGPAQAPIYGVYYADQDKWDEAKAEFNISASNVADGDVSGEEAADPRTEAALRQAAEETANAEAERVRTAEELELSKVTGENGEPAKNTAAPAARRGNR